MGTYYSKLILNEFKSDTICSNSIDRYRKHIEQEEFHNLVNECVMKDYKGVAVYFNEIGQLNEKQLDGCYLLNYAVTYGSPKIFKYILDNVENIDENSMLFACYNNRKMMLKLLIEKGGNIGDLLFKCCIRNSVMPSIIELLLDKGADVNERSMLNRTPLYYAMRNRDIPIMGLLIRRGANISDISDDDIIDDDNGRFIMMMKLNKLAKRCPTCRIVSKFHKLFIGDVEIVCCICLEKSNSNYSGTCGHTVCEVCYKKWF